MNEAAQPKTLFDLIAEFWQARVFVLLGILCGGALAFGFMSAATPSYRAQMILSPANPMNGAEVSSLLADDNLFALRYLVQRVGVANSSDFMRFENTYDGVSVAELLLKDQKILSGLHADKSFSFSHAKGNWSAPELAEYIHENVRFENVGVSSMRRMMYLHPDPQFGVYFLQNIHRLTDELIRLKIKQDAGQRIRYLQQVIDETDNPEHKRALTTLLLEQERLRMLVSIESPYAASVIEPASSSVKPAWPDAKLVFPLGILFGALVGFALFGLRTAIEYAQFEEESGQRRRGKKYGYWYKLDHKNSNDASNEEGASEAAE